jgi:CheY-like chemotaxis protein
MTKSNYSLKSILIVDDSQESLDLYSDHLRSRTNAHVMCTRYPSVAIKWANKYFFDTILIDVTINYNGTQYGGLEVYKSLKDRYGASSLIVYSQFITDDLLKRYEYEFNFIEKREDPGGFIDEVLKKMNSLRNEQSCFVAMPYSTIHNTVFNIIKKCVKNAGYKCIRVDQQQFTKSIIDKVLFEIRNAKLIIFLATDQNPNAFYECGYAVALDKEVITLTDVYESLPFDIKHRNSIAYGKELPKLKTVLDHKLANLTHIPLQ